MRLLLPFPPRQRLVLSLLSIYLFIYIFAVPMLVFDLVPTWGEWMGGALLILLGSILALWLTINAGRRGMLAAIAIGLLSFLIEYIGVESGWPFGRYIYTDTLGLKVLGSVPLAIPFAWLLVVPGALGVASYLVNKRWRIPLAAALALGLDLLIEPVAAHIVHYWHWIDGGPYYAVPTANFIAWGTTALVLAAITRWLVGPDLQRFALPWLPGLLYSLNLIQFMLVDLAYGYHGAALIGVGLLLLVVIAARHARHAWNVQQTNQNEQPTNDATSSLITHR